jgi:hypothetical protein
VRKELSSLCLMGSRPWPPFAERAVRGDFILWGCGRLTIAEQGNGLFRGLLRSGWLTHQAHPHAGVGHTGRWIFG